ncbi:unnamed protein product, partial [Durusdinium trenchii]
VSHDPTGCVAGACAGALPAALRLCTAASGLPAAGAESNGAVRAREYVMAPVPAPILPTSSYLTPGGVDMQNPFAYQSGMPVMATSGSFVAPVGTTSAPPPIGLPTGPAPTAPAPSTAPAPLPSAGSFVPPPTGPYVPPPLHPSTGSFVPQHYMPYAPMTSTGSFVPPLVPSGSFVPMPTSHSSSVFPRRAPSWRPRVPA